MADKPKHEPPSQEEREKMRQRFQALGLPPGLANLPTREHIKQAVLSACKAATKKKGK